MKKICYLASLAIAMLFAGCSSDNDELGQENNQNVKYESMTVGVNMPGNDTRIDFNGEVTNMVWADGDQLKVIGRDANGKTIGETNINIQPGFTALNASFSGDVVSADNYEFAYLGKGTYQGDAGVSYDWDYMNDKYNANCKYDEQVVVLNSFDHLKKHLFMNSERLAKADLKNGAKVALNHNTSVFRLNVLDVPEEIKTASDLRISLYINYETTSTSPVAVGNLYIYGGIPTGSNNYIYLAFDPVGHAAVQGKTIAVKFESLGNASYGDKPVLATCIAKATSSGKTYQAGGIYKANISAAGPGFVWEKKEVDPGTGDNDLVEIYSVDFATQAAFDSCNWLKKKKNSNTSDPFISYDSAEGCIKIGFNPQVGANEVYYAYTPKMKLKPTKNVLSITYRVEKTSPANYLDINAHSSTRNTGKTLNIDLSMSAEYKTAEVEIPSSYYTKPNFYVQFKFQNDGTGNFIRVKNLSIKGK